MLVILGRCFQIDIIFVKLTRLFLFFRFAVVTQKATWVLQRLAVGAVQAPHPECHRIL